MKDKEPNVGTRQRENELHQRGIHCSEAQVDMGKLDDLMSQSDRLLPGTLHGTPDASISFEGICQWLRRLGFDERIRGRHHIFTRKGAKRSLNCSQETGTRHPTRSSKYTM